MNPEWAALARDLAARRDAARAMGGPEKLARRAESGRGDARTRLDALLDPGSMVEIGLLAGDGVPADAFVAARGAIGGQPVLVGAEDASVAGGSIGVAGATKRARLIELAGRGRSPLVLVLDGAGHRVTNLLHPHRPAPNDLQLLADLAGVVPIVTIVAGPAAGHSALAAPLSDFVVMVEPHGALFTAGPPVVRASTGEAVSKERLGGARVHCRVSGVAHNAVADDDAAAALVRTWLRLIGVPREPSRDGSRETARLAEIIPVDPRRPYDMRQVVAETTDAGSVLELQPDYGDSLVVALARIGGRAIGVVANQPLVRAGAIDVAAAEKGAWFLTQCGRFGVPVLFLADTPGVLAGSVSEEAGILRAAGRMYAAQRALTVPKFHVTVRKAFGFGSSVMAANPFDRQWVSLALPTATLGGLPARAGAATGAYTAAARELADAEDAGPWRFAATGAYDDVVAPHELRNRLLAEVSRLPD